MIGKVISNKMKDTIVVLVERRIMHPRYKKFIQRTTKLHVHDLGNKAKVGSLVSVKECRPFSKNKNWTLIGEVM